MTYRQIHPRDNVAVLLRAEGDIPAGHKIALRPIAAENIFSCTKAKDKAHP